MKDAFWGCLTLKIMFGKINFRENLGLRKRTIFRLGDLDSQTEQKVGGRPEKQGREVSTGAFSVRTQILLPSRASPYFSPNSSGFYF